MRKSFFGDAGCYRLYAFGERRVIALTSRRTAERLVRKGRAEEGLDLDGKTVCFRMLICAKKPSASRQAPGEVISDSEESSRAFSNAELMAIAGRHFRHGRSRTARLTEAQRAARAQRIYEESVARTGYGRKVGPEDIVERATNKYDAWQQIGSLLNEVKTVESVCL